MLLWLFFFNDTATTEIYTLSLHDALPISSRNAWRDGKPSAFATRAGMGPASSSVSRSEEHTSELQSPCNLVCRLLLEKKKCEIWPRGDHLAIRNYTTAKHFCGLLLHGSAA